MPGKQLLREPVLELVPVPVPVPLLLVIVMVVVRPDGRSRWAAVTGKIQNGDRLGSWSDCCWQYLSFRH